MNATCRRSTARSLRERQGKGWSHYISKPSHKPRYITINEKSREGATSRACHVACRTSCLEGAPWRLNMPYQEVAICASARDEYIRPLVFATSSPRARCAVKTTRVTIRLVIYPLYSASAFAMCQRHDGNNADMFCCPALPSLPRADGNHHALARSHDAANSPSHREKPEFTVTKNAVITDTLQVTVLQTLPRRCA